MSALDQGGLDQALAELGREITPPTSQLEEELALLVLATRAGARHRGRPRRVAVWAGAGAVGMLIAGAGAAAAAGLWQPWAEHPDGAFHYTLPSGATCEERVGDMSAASPELREAVGDILAEDDLVATSDVDRWVERYSTDAEFLDVAAAWVESERSPLRTVEDYVHQAAISRAVWERVEQQVTERGLTWSEGDGVAVRGQWICEQVAK